MESLTGFAAPHLIILGLQALGGAAGNMITVHNVVAASATVGLVGREGLLIRRTILPMAYYVVSRRIVGVAVLLRPGGRCLLSTIGPWGRGPESLLITAAAQRTGIVSKYFDRSPSTTSV